MKTVTINNVGYELEINSISYGGVIALAEMEVINEPTVEVHKDNILTELWPGKIVLLQDGMEFIVS